MHSFPITALLFLTAFIPYQERSSTDSFLKKPFDLQAFKKAKGQSNSGVADKEKYYYKPGHDGVYFYFFMFVSPGFVYDGTEKKKTTVRTGTGLSIVTYKRNGKYRDQYIDPTETLIEVIAWYNDADLPGLALVGLDTVAIKKKLGDRFIRKDSCFIYTNENYALTLNISGNAVKWLKYTVLNAKIIGNNIPPGLTANRNKNLKVR